MALAATYIDGSQFTVAGDKTEEFAQNRRVRADCGADGDKFSSVSSSSYDGGSNKTTVVLNESVLTSNLAQVWFGIVGPQSSLQNYTISTSDPSGGRHGDLWFKVSS